MGMLSAFLGGAGQVGAQMATSHMNSLDRIDEYAANMLAKLEAAKGERADMTAAISERQSGIREQMTADKIAGGLSSDQKFRGLSMDDLSDAGKAQLADKYGKLTDKEDRTAYIRAARDEGYISPEKYAEMARRDEQTEATLSLRDKINEVNEAGRNARNTETNNTQRDNATNRLLYGGKGGASGPGAGSRGIGGENLGKVIDSATKPFMSAFEANKDAGSPADEQGKAAYFMLVRDGIASGKDSTQVAALAMRRILDARSAAQGDDKKYLMLLNAMLTPPKPPMTTDEQEAMRENRLFQQLGGSGPAAKGESSGDGGPETADALPQHEQGLLATARRIVPSFLEQINSQRQENLSGRIVPPSLPR